MSEGSTRSGHWRNVDLSINIRDAKKDDFQDCLRLLSYLWPKLRFDISKVRDIFMKKLGSDDHRLLVAEEESSIIGLAFYYKVLDFEIQDYICMLDELVVDKNRRGEGIGSSLLSRIEYLEPGVPIWLFSSTKRKKAHKFYKNKGFKNNALFFQKNHF